MLLGKDKLKRKCYGDVDQFKRMCNVVCEHAIWSEWHVLGWNCDHEVWFISTELAVWIPLHCTEHIGFRIQAVLCLVFVQYVPVSGKAHCKLYFLLTTQFLCFILSHKVHLHHRNQGWNLVLGWLIYLQKFPARGVVQLRVSGFLHFWFCRAEYVWLVKCSQHCIWQLWAFWFIVLSLRLDLIQLTVRLCNIW